MNGAKEYRAALSQPGPLQELVRERVQHNRVNLVLLGQALGYQVSDGDCERIAADPDGLSTFELELVSGGATCQGPSGNSNEV